MPEQPAAIGWDDERLPDDALRIEAMTRIEDELFDAVHKFPPFNSPHEGYAVIREELEELWAHAKANTGLSPEAMKEAIQVATMAVRYFIDMGVQRRVAEINTAIAVLGREQKR